MAGTHPKQNMQQSSRATPKDDQAVQPPAISLPKGGGAIRGMGEKFAAM